VLRLGVSMYVFAKKENVYLYVIRIHNTNLKSAYFGLENRGCECLEYRKKIDPKYIPIHVHSYTCGQSNRVVLNIQIGKNI
jgi:hypothetical protein